MPTLHAGAGRAGCAASAGSRCQSRATAVAVGQRNVFGAQLEVRARCDDDHILAGGVDGDQRNAGRAARALQPVEADPCALETRERSRGELVATIFKEQYLPRAKGGRPIRGVRR